jgi:hypothetical protein
VGELTDACTGYWVVLGYNAEGLESSEHMTREEAALAATRRAEKHGGTWTVARVWGYLKPRPRWLMPADAAKEGA